MFAPRVRFAGSIAQAPALFPERAESNRIRGGADQPAMTEQDIAEVADIIAGAAPLPLLDTAYALWRRRYRLDTLEGRPTAEEVRANRAMTREQWAIKYRYDRDHAQDGPAFDHVKRAHPRASDNAIRL